MEMRILPPESDEKRGGRAQLQHMWQHGAAPDDLLADAAHERDDDDGDDDVEAIKRRALRVARHGERADARAPRGGVSEIPTRSAAWAERQAPSL